MTGLTVKNATAWNNKGLAYIALGRSQDALTCFQTALGIDPNYIDAQTNEQTVIGKVQNFNISGTITPVVTISRIGTFYTTATPTPPPTTVTTPPAGIITTPVTATPVPRKTTYSPLLPLSALGAVSVAGGLVLALKRK